MPVDVVELLGQLGLTEYEAKTLSTLFKLRETEAPEISRLAQVPKTRVYDVLERLTKKGLVIEIYGRPKKYRVLEPEAVFEELIRGKKTEISELEDKSKKAKNFLLSTKSPEDLLENGEKVMKVKDRNDFLRILAQEIDSAKSEVVAFSRLEDQNSALSSPFLKDSFKNALDRKVSVKMLSRAPKAMAGEIKAMAKHGLDFKDHDHGMNAYVIDGRKVILALSDFSKEKPEYHFTIWNNHRPMAAAMQKYFDHCWQQGKEV